MSGLVGSTRIFEMFCVSVSPIFVHVLPASLDLYAPSPWMLLPRMSASPAPPRRCATVSAGIRHTRARTVASFERDISRILLRPGNAGNAGDNDELCRRLAPPP